MERSLSLLKPCLETVFLENEINEKATLLNIPDELGMEQLHKDIKMGAAQFSELEELVNKENEPQYIIISTDNLEQGYMAVTYLAGCFNAKKETLIDVPVIKTNELRNSFSSGDDTFSMGPTFILGEQNRMQHTPYWMHCSNSSVCIVSAGEYPHMGMGQNWDFLSDALEYFRTKDKVYLIVVQNEYEYGFVEEAEEDKDDEIIYDRRGIWNSIVLSFSADEATVKLKKTAKKYYKLLFQSVFHVKKISVQKRFPYERLVNLISVMGEQNKCKLVENVVNYAVKDWKTLDDHPITNADFAFIDRFCRKCANDKKKNKRAKDRMVSELVGMDDVKKQVFNIVNVMKYNKIREQMGIRGGSYHNVHLMLGAPGTAKTTVAKYMGQIMMDEKLLPDNRFVCVNGAELKGMYVGHSAPKTKDLFEENDIIVIDEAYSLVGDHGENDSFSKEALAQLIIEIENHSMDKLVILAGYGGRHVTQKDNKMKDFLDANPGIKSRITSTIYFDSYNADEMVNIFACIAKNQKYKLENGYEKIVHDYFRKRITDSNFGNGREARSLLETSVVFAAERVLRDNKAKYTKKEMQTILYQDIEKAIRQAENIELLCGEKNKGFIGFTA